MSIIYLLNLVPTKIVFDITPIKKWSGGKLLFLHLKTFKCIEWVNILNGCIKILDVKSHACIIMSYYEESKAYRLFDIIKQHTIFQRDVIFDEKTSCIKLLHSTSSLMSNGPFEIVIELRLTKYHFGASIGKSIHIPSLTIKLPTSFGTPR